MEVKQSIPLERRFTIEQFNRMFPDHDAGLDWLMAQRYPGYMAQCSYCNVERKFHRVTTRKVYSCDHCGTMIAPMAGTIFEKSSTSLRLWFYAMYLMSATRCGISAKQIQRKVGVSHKTAWRMFKQIRTLMSEDIRLERTTVEEDEMYFGVKSKNKHRSKRKGFDGRSNDDKTPVFGMIERGGRVVAMVTPVAKAGPSFRSFMSAYCQRALSTRTIIRSMTNWLSIRMHTFIAAFSTRRRVSVIFRPH